MKKYKVIKDFGSVLKGDVFTFEDDWNGYVCSVIDDNSSRYMAIEANAMDSFVKSGFLMEINDKSEEADTIEECLEFIDSLQKKYLDNLMATREKADKGEIQPCVMVEAQTVYYNLNKVLNAVKNKLIK